MTITSKNFTKTVTSILSAYGKLSDKIQDVIIFALTHYVETGNTVFVQKLLTMATTGQRLRASDIKLIITFIREFTNISIKVDNNFEYKVTKKSKKESPVFNKPDDSITWYNFSKVSNAISTFDLVQIAAALNDRYTKAKEDDKKKVTNQLQSEKFLTRLNSLVAEFQPATK